MSALTFSQGAAWIMGLLILVCCAIVLWPHKRPRNRFVKNSQVQRERITITLPSTWLNDFLDRK